MATFLYKTRGNSSPERKPRVYFTCHPEDFSKYFEQICESLFQTHDCAVFYTENMSEEIEEKYKESDLGQMNLFVIPVTFKLLSRPNRAMDSDFCYAMEKHIPVLPIMMEPGLDVLYSRSDKFGELQYLDPNASDLTAISYAEKLKKYLEAVLISDELAERIRKAFDAYIFLSYRKKDRHYANELMKLIHSHPEFRDIAIWYDEFLTPGESFRENIEKMMQNSKLFTLLVTPSLLEYVDGKPNYVMEHEYPDAKLAGMDILPTEMEETDREALCSEYPEIPDCVDPKEDAIFRSRLAEKLSMIAISANNNDPEHNFLIGLAYLEGIDVETDKERGIALITSAAEANCLEAMQKLFAMYYEGKGIPVDYHKALVWIERIVEYCEKNYGEENPDTLTARSDLASIYLCLGNYEKAVELNKQVYALRCKVLGAEHPDTLISMSNLAVSYDEHGHYEKASELNRQVYSLCSQILGEEHSLTLTVLNNWATTYDEQGHYEKALKLHEQAYALYSKLFGEEHLDTLRSMNNLVTTYCSLKDYKNALQLGERVYTLRCKLQGEEHPHTLTALNNLAHIYGELGDRTKALELHEKVYLLRCKVLGEEHPDSLLAKSNLAADYGKLDDYLKESELEERVYALQCKVLGEEHPDTLTTLGNLACSYGELNDYLKELELEEKLYKLRCKVLGEEHPDALNTLNNLAETYLDCQNYAKSVELFEQLHALRCKVLGEEHSETLKTLYKLLEACYNCGDDRKTLEVCEQIYALQIKVLGECHLDTLKILNNMVILNERLGKTKKALMLNKKLIALRRKVGRK